MNYHDIFIIFVHLKLIFIQVIVFFIIINYHHLFYYLIMKYQLNLYYYYLYSFKYFLYLLSCIFIDFKYFFIIAQCIQDIHVRIFVSFKYGNYSIFYDFLVNFVVNWKYFILIYEVNILHIIIISLIYNFLI
jgi:hypothetical protein